MWFCRQRRRLPERRSAGTLFEARKRLPWPQDRDFRILAIDGGGIRGILPLALLARLEAAHLGGSSIASYFDMAVGTSTGGIIALGLGIGRRATDIFDLYMDRGGDVFPHYGRVTRWWLEVSQCFVNRCDHEQLYKLIDEALGNRQIGESSIRLCIPAAETRYFEPFIFKTPHHPDYKLDWKVAMAHAAKTTSAAPTFFAPIVDDHGYEFIDGGIWANNPIMVGIADALACFDIRREQIRVLSLGCVQDQFSMSWFRRYLGGRLFWTSIILESMYIQSQNATGQARLIVGGDRVLRVDWPPVHPRLDLWNWSRCRDELPAFADKLFKLHGDQIAKAFLGQPAGPYKPFYKCEKSREPTALR